MDTFIASIETIEINKLRALKDVRFSNSHAEAVNKILKCNYLNNQEIYNTRSLENRLEENIHDLNLARPHGAIHGLIPIERYTGKPFDNIQRKEQLKQARKERIQQNKYFECGTCKL